MWISRVFSWSSLVNDSCDWSWWLVIANCMGRIGQYSGNLSTSYDWRFPKLNVGTPIQNQTLCWSVGKSMLVNWWPRFTKQISMLTVIYFCFFFFIFFFTGCSMYNCPPFNSLSNTRTILFCSFSVSLGNFICWGTAALSFADFAKQVHNNWVMDAKVISSHPYKAVNSSHNKLPIPQNHPLLGIRNVLGYQFVNLINPCLIVQVRELVLLLQITDLQLHLTFVEFPQLCLRYL